MTKIKSNPSSAEHWFYQGGLYNSISSEHFKVRNSLIEEGVITPENAVFLLFGMANKIVDDYFQNKEKHLETIDSFFFSLSKNKSMEEAEKLNNLGLADKILTNTDEFMTTKISANLNTDAWMKYARELGGILRKIDLEENSSYRIIKSINKEAVEKIEIIGKELSNLYVASHQSNFMNYDYILSAYRLNFWQMKEKIEYLQDISSKQINGNKQFPHASEFLDKHVFAPTKKSQNIGPKDKILSKYANQEKTNNYINTF